MVEIAFGIITEREYDDEGEEIELDYDPTKIVDICYSIIQESKTIVFPLEIILDRINCSNHEDYTTHPFSGFTLANYVKAWWNQKGRKKVWRNKGELDFYLAFPDFEPISSDA